MAETSWPTAAPAVITEHDHERLWSAYYQTGLVGDPTQPALVFADATGLQVKVRADRLAQVRGFSWYSGATEVTVPISANASGATRTDLVTLRLDRSTWEVRLHVIEGTPGAGSPTSTRDEGPAGVWDLIIGIVTVPNGAVTISAANVSFRQSYLGAQPLVADDGVGEGGNSSYRLRYAPNDDELMFLRPGGSGRLVLWLDSGEVALAGSNSNWTASSDIVIQKINNTVHLRYAAVQRTAGNLGGGVDSTLPGSIPPSMRHPTRDQQFTVRTTGADAGQVTIIRANGATPGRISLINHAGIASGEFVSSFTAVWLVP